MTVPKPTLTPYSPGRSPGDKPTNVQWNAEVLQQGARTQLLIEPVTVFPTSPAATDWCNRSDLNALFQCINATGPVWSQMSIGAFTTVARPAAPPTNFVYFDTTLSAFYEWNGATYASVSSGGGGGTASAFWAYNSGTQTFTGGAGAAKVLMASTVFNVGGNYSTTTSLYTAPATGQYLLTGTLALVNSSVANLIEIFEGTNGGTTTTLLASALVPVSATVQTVPFAALLTFNAGDTVEITATAATTVTTSASPYTVWQMSQVGVGPAGTAGAAGAPGITWQGAYAGGTTYALHDGVTNGGESFLSLAAGNVGNTPTAGTGDAHWLILAQKGGTGTTGAAGITWQGAWLVGTTYALHDGVTNGGESFLSLGAGNVGNTPTAGTGDAHWLILAQKGTTGAAGAGLTWRGLWSSATAYAINDAVFSAGSAWVALTAGTNQALPAAGASNANWSALTQAGAAGTWAHGSTFPGSPALNDPYFRDDLHALFFCSNATGPVWSQVSVGDWTSNPGSPTTNLRIWRTDLGVELYYDGTNWRRADPVVFAPSIEIKPTAAQVLLRVQGLAYTIRTTTVSAQAGTAATAQADSLLQKNGTTFGTIRFAASGTTATLVSMTETTFAATDVLTLLAPASVDGTLAKIAYTITGDKQ